MKERIPNPFNAASRFLDCLGSPIAGLTTSLFIAYGFIVLTFTKVISSNLGGLGKESEAVLLAMFALPWLLAAMGFLVGAMRQHRRLRLPSQHHLRITLMAVLALIVVGLALHVAAIMWGAMEGQTCDRDSDSSAAHAWQQACEDAALDAATGPSILHLISSCILLVTIPLAPVLSLYRIRLRGFTDAAGDPLARQAHAWHIMRLGGMFLLGAGVFAILFWLLEWGLVSELPNYFSWTFESRRHPVGELLIDSIWISATTISPLLGITLLAQSNLSRIAWTRRLPPTDRDRFEDLTGRDSLSGILDSNRSLLGMAFGFLVASFLVVLAPTASVYFMGECRDCGAIAYTVWPLLAAANAIILLLWSGLLAGVLAGTGRAIRNRGLRNAAQEPAQRLESLYAMGTITRKRFEEHRSLIQPFGRGRPPGEPQHTLGRFLATLFPVWLIALLAWLLIAFSAIDDLRIPPGHSATFQTSALILLIPTTILLVTLMVTGWSMSALGKQKTREAFLDIQRRTEELLHEANKKKRLRASIS